MDSLQAKADKLAGVFTLAILGAFGAGAFFYSTATDSAEVEDTVNVQILSLAQEVTTPALGDPDGGFKEEVEEVVKEPEPEPKPVVKEALKPAPAPEVVKPKPPKVEVKKPVKKKKPVVKKKPEVKKAAVLPKAKPTDGKGNGNQKGTPKGSPASKTQSASTGQVYKNAFSSLLSRVSSLKEYPSRARRQGIEGKCVISFKVNSSGIVTAASVTQTSGQVVLDSACKRLGSKLVGFNTGAKGGDFNVKVPVNYTLVD